MKLTVNGKELTIEKSINLKELLTAAKAEQPDYVTVELNGEFVDHSGFETTYGEPRSIKKTTGTDVTKVMVPSKSWDIPRA